jgi:hypothetical protein
VISQSITPGDLSDAVEVDFEEEHEFWNSYRLSDGSTLKVKLVLLGVKRLKKHLPDGTPIYIVNAQHLVRAVNIPEELKAKPTSRPADGTYG